MSDLKTTEAWQVEVFGQIYDADLSALSEWIAEGSLQPEDKVRRGNLRWIEARKVPALMPFFNAKAAGLAMPVVVTTTDAADKRPEPQPNIKTAAVQLPAAQSVPVAAPVSAVSPLSLTQTGANVCRNHPERPAMFVCLTCEAMACRECVRSYGSSVRVCTACGGMCEKREQVESQERAREMRGAALSKGFGFADFGEALAYPFRFKTSLIAGAIMYMFFSLGTAASSMGGIYMMSASIFCYMLANMLVFGVLSHTIESFAHGKIGGSFMPDFDDFSIWDDVLHPFFLYIGVYISSFGAFLLVLAIGAYLVMSTVTSQLDAMKTNLEQTPGTPYYSTRDTVDQSNQVRSILSESEKVNQQHLDAQESIENGQAPAVVDPEEAEFQRINKMIAESKRKELESVVGKSPETRDQESAAFVTGLLKLAAPIVVIGFITFLWGAFYFPAACTVAGYTQSFMATINPLVGMDTIKRLGFDYVKVLFMSFLLLIGFAVVSVIVSMVFGAFDIPGFGNLPARAIESGIWFYLMTVFACLLGFAMFKASDRLKLYN